MKVKIEARVFDPDYLETKPTFHFIDGDIFFARELKFHIFDPPHTPAQNKGLFIELEQ